jgi:hypothetical protein
VEVLAAFRPLGLLAAEEILHAACTASPATAVEEVSEEVPQVEALQVGHLARPTAACLGVARSVARPRGVAELSGILANSSYIFHFSGLDGT